MYPGIFPGACRKGEVIYDRLHYCRNHYDGCGFCFCDNGNDEASISDAVTERYMESVKEKNGGLQKKERELLH